MAATESRNTGGGSTPGARAWFLIDEASATLIAIPSLRGVTSRARLLVHRMANKEVVLTIPVPAGETTSMDLSELPRLFDFGLRLQRWEDTGWVSATGIERISPTPDVEVHRIRPADWGVSRECVVSLRDVQTRRTVLRAIVAAQASLTTVVNFPDGRKLQLDFFDSGDGEAAGSRIVPAMRLVPLYQRGTPDREPVVVSDGLTASHRRDVVLAPLQLASAGRGASLATGGALGAWQHGEAIVEAMEFVLGRQRYQFQSMPETHAEEVVGPVIYAGPTHGSWGHFLTQGLSRLWFAMRHPSVPILWDSRRMAPYQQQVLDVLGITNPQLFLTSTTRFSEVIFPYPGLSLGDYVSTAFAREIGAVEPGRVEPGKRLLLTRARLAHGRGAIAASQDRTLESIAAEHGFTMFAPEEHTLREQLAELSSAETVLGVEGSAFHTLLLLRGALPTRYWALTRHRGGDGVFQHIKTAKDLKYETLNLLRHGRNAARDAIDLDLDLLDDLLQKTSGLSDRLELVEPYLERPSAAQTSFEQHIQNTQVHMTPLEQDLSDAGRALRRGDIETAQRIVGGLV